MKILFSILLTAGTIIMVILLIIAKAATTVCEFVGNQSSKLYDQHPAITIAAATILISYGFLNFISQIWSV